MFEYYNFHNQVDLTCKLPSVLQAIFKNSSIKFTSCIIFELVIVHHTASKINSLT